MSGQPYKSPIDISTARQAYLANLKLRAEIDDKNLQANKVYVKTGQLPVEPTDTRTTTEKLADIQRLKIDVASKLSEIADGENSQAIINQLTTDQVQFLSQNFQPIKEQIKKMYAMGVLAPIFMDYLQRYMDKYTQTRGVELGLQQTAGNQLLANQQVIMATMASKQELDDVNASIKDLGIESSAFGRSILQNVEDIKALTTDFPVIFDKINKENNEITKSQIIETLTSIIDELPSKQDLERALIQLEKNVASSNVEGIKASLVQLKNLTETGTDIAEQIAILNKLLGQNIVPIPTTAVSISSGPQPPPVQKGVALTQRQQEIQSKYRPIASPEFSNNEKRLAYIRRLVPYLIKDENDQPLQMLRNDAGDVFEAYRPWILNIYGREPTAISKDELKDAIGRVNRGLRILGWGDENAPGVGNGMCGTGMVKRVRPSQVFETDIDFKAGIRPSPKFAPMGRYLINKRQLDKDIIAIKRPAGSTIPNLPSQRVSRNFGNVMRKIIGNGIPTFDELNSLTDEERVYLHKVAKESRIDDKLNIPTPKKDEDEKDINEFEILKGQILAGNDNKDVVKKFKTIMLKLSRKDLIPKAQVKDLLMDLATLGH